MQVAVSESAPSAEARIICRVCQKQFSRYTCPRCNIKYCCLECYKKHSLRCTESFTRENVMEELQQVRADDDTRKKMMDILKRFHLDEEMDYDAEHESVLSEHTVQKVVQKVLSGNELKLEDLSPDEIKKFRSAVASGELSKMIVPWTPWWRKSAARAIYLSCDGSQLIRPLNKEEMACPSNTKESNLSDVPDGPESPIPTLRQLRCIEPSALLTIHIIDILYSYCFTLRLYNGDWHDDAIGAAMMIFSVSAVLGEDRKPETVAEALVACLEHTCSPMYRHMASFQFGIDLFDDVVALLSLGRNAIICLLCDLQRMFRSSVKMLSPPNGAGESKKGESNRKVRLAERKASFLVCWIHEQPEEVWTSLVGIVESEKASLSTQAYNAKNPDVHAKGKLLIREI